MNPAAADRRRLTLLDATCIMVGIVVGSGIFRTPADVAGMSGSTLEFMSLWIAGGLASLMGAACFAELSTRYPEDGGAYAFLDRAYGPRTSFLFAWTDFWIVRPSNVGAVALVLGDYAQAALPLERWRPMSPTSERLTYAIAAVLLTTLLHLRGVQLGRWSQNAMSITKLVGLALVVLAALSLSSGSGTSTSTVETSATLWQRWPAAFVLVMFCYGGWSDLSNVAGEVKDPNRNLLRALVLGVAAIMVVYLAVNGAAMHALGLQGLGTSKAFAAKVVEIRLAGWGEPLIGGLVAIACLSSLSGVVFTGARVYFALGLHHRLFGWLAGWDSQLGTPPQSLLAQAAISCVLLLFAGQDANGFERLVILAAPCYWGFIALASLGLIVLRYRDHATPLTFRVPLYPITPVLFAALCGGMVVASTTFVVENFGLEAFYSLAVLLVGAGMLIFAPKGPRRDSPGQRPGKA